MKIKIFEFFSVKKFELKQNYLNLKGLKFFIKLNSVKLPSIHNENPLTIFISFSANNTKTYTIAVCI